MKFFICLTLAILSAQSYARTVARVSFVQGNAFVFDSTGQSMSLGFGSKVGDLAEVMVEDGSSLTLVNNSDDKIHVTGGSLVKFFNGSVELKNGKLWIDSNSSVGNFVHTSNSLARYNKGQFIYSYDNIDGKSQVLSIEGSVEFSNVLEPDLKIQVPSGFFTFVDQSYEHGLPRGATKVGLNSYKKMRASFVSFDSLRKNDFDHVEKSLIKREIASVNDKSVLLVKKRGNIINITTISNEGRTPASAEVSPLNYYKNIKKETKKKYTHKRTGQTATIRVFGAKTMTPKIVSNKITIPAPRTVRAPASIGSSQIIKELKTLKSGFESSLKVNINQNQKHSTEVNHLIDELNSYKKDFNKNY